MSMSRSMRGDLFKYRKPIRRDRDAADGNSSTGHICTPEPTIMVPMESLVMGLIER